MSSLTQLSVVLPVLNERDNLAELIPELCSALSPVLDAVEIIVVDPYCLQISAAEIHAYVMCLARASQPHFQIP